MTPKYRIYNKKQKEYERQDSKFFLTQKGILAHLYSEEISRSDYVIQFFTGARDKNGTEIYEGDILSCPWSYNPEMSSKGFVVFFEGSFRLAKEEHHNSYDLWDFNNTSTRFYFWDRAEIVGNIFEKSS